MIRSFVRSLAALSLLLAATQCDSPTGPLEAPAAFELRTVDGDALPAVWVENEFVKTEVLAETLYLYGDGTGLQRATYRSTRPGQAPETYTSESRLEYTLDGARLEITFECRDVVIRPAVCLAGPHAVGLASDDVLRLATFFENSVVYRRVQAPVPVPEG
ncbi:MAG TPA: hypothetical protein VF746_06015 [Longimicrobium sp.]|jgi:hypothetical protein